MPGINSRHWDVIVDALAAGPIVDPSGLATQKLMALTGHESTNALAKILRRMEEAGIIERDVNGRRTTRIALTEDAGAAHNAVAERPAAAKRDSAPPETDSDGIDYDLLAAALLAKALKATEAQELAAGAKDAQARAERAEAARRIAEADAQAARAKVAELEATLRQMEKNISILQAAADKPQRRGSTVAERISPAEKRALQELEQLLRQPPSRRG